MDARFFHKRSGFTLIELAMTMGLSAFALGGFMLLWTAVAKQEDQSWTERTVDSYGNFLMYRINQDLKNAFTYSLTQSANLAGIDMMTVDYSYRIPDTVRIHWQVKPNGDASRYSNIRNSNQTTTMFKEFSRDFAQYWNRRPNEHMRCTGFTLIPVGRLLHHENDLGLLDSSGVQMNLSLTYTHARPYLTVNNRGGTGALTTYTRKFSWTTMVYLRNFYITRYNAGNASLY